MRDEILTLHEVAGLLKVARQDVYTMVQRAELRHSKSVVNGGSNALTSTFGSSSKRRQLPKMPTDSADWRPMSVVS